MNIKINLPSSIIWILLVIYLPIVACNSLKHMPMIHYTDQNNNTYIVSKKNIEYRAVKPMESSSGQYSGGANQSVAILSSKYQELSRLATELLDDSASHAQRREMLTAVLRVGEPPHTRNALLYRSEKRKEFEAMLKDAISGEE